VFTECVLEIAHRTSAADETDAGALRSVTKTPHHVMTKKIGKQNHHFDAAREYGGAAPLVNTVPPADVSRNANAKLAKHLGNVAQAIGADEQGAGLNGVCRNCIHDFIVKLTPV
jgi:hypothetical protein